MHQLAEEHKHNFPRAAKIIQENFYVDDLMSGANTVREAYELKVEISDILESAGFQLRKWKSNSQIFLNTIPSDELEASPLNLEDDTQNTVKILGIQWEPVEDNFIFTVRPTTVAIPTKRAILSDSSRIFDPMGWLSPATVKLKIIFQRLWLLNLGWDDEVPKQVAAEWLAARRDFTSFTRLSIPRCIIKSPQKLELHGYSDASDVAYAGVVYLKCIDDNGESIVSLVAAKTKVAPIKPLTTAKLELCGALLLTRLMIFIKTTLERDMDVFAWTDSTTVLAWLSTDPRKWKTFVANRTSEILSMIPRNCWHHVKGPDNPADCASRGISPSQLKEHHLWWHGPHWLTSDRDQWEQSSDIVDSSDRVYSEAKTQIHTLYASSQNCTNDLIEFNTIISQFSNWTKLIRVFAFCHRYLHNLRGRNSEKKYGVLTTAELLAAKYTCFRIAQSTEFASELISLRAKKQISCRSSIIQLHPILDENGIIRVGGRLHNSSLSFSTKHQIILPKRHHVTTLIIQHTHIKYLHAGCSAMTSILRQEYWILNARNIVRHFILKCVVCIRHRGTAVSQLMGSLPCPRVIHQTRPFIHTGVDYAGPITLKVMHGRTARNYKGYIALFVCMTTKALHIELVSDLSSESFIATLRRFVSRRGLPTAIYSDNGTNFVGAYKEVRELHKILSSELHNTTIANYLAADGIDWKFQPPYAPNFGGLWESGVKSVKSHLRRVVGNTILTYEQMTTLLCQIEAVLNSRPLCPLSNDVNDMEALTPGHFLIGQSMSTVPDPTLDIIKTNRLSKWQFVQKLYQGFWKRWRNEYLTSLQLRSKWCKDQINLQPGDLVLIKDDNIPSSKWSLGRVIKCIPGLDGKTRVVEVNTKAGIIKRPITKLCLLASSEED